jgi:hypothetical protein
MATKATMKPIYPPEQARPARHMAEMIALGMETRGEQRLAAAIRKFADGMTGLTANDVVPDPDFMAVKKFVDARQV